MIQSFGDKETQLIYHQKRSLKLPGDIQSRALVKLMLLDAAEAESDLRAPPSNRLEKLHGDFEGFWSIRINAQWRIVFRFESGHAYEVSITDYHS